MGNSESSPSCLKDRRDSSYRVDRLDSAVQQELQSASPNAPIKNRNIHSKVNKRLLREETVKKEESRIDELIEDFEKKYFKDQLSLDKEWKEIIKAKFRLTIAFEANGAVKTHSAKPKGEYENESLRTLEFQAISIQQQQETEKGSLLQKKDNRTRLSGTQNYPLSVHGVVKVDNGDGVFQWGSGILIAADLVLTAAHCIYPKGSNQRFKNIHFIPGINGNEAPFGEVGVTDAYVPSRYLESWEHEDYGVLMLNEPVGEKTGYFGLHAATHHVLEEMKIALVGYPADKVKEKPGTYEQWGFEGAKWWTDENEKNEGEEGVMEYQEVTSPGQDGGGVYYHDSHESPDSDDNQYYVVGVHIGGRFTENDTFGQATWITQDRIKQILQWTFNAKRKLLSQKSKVLDFADAELSNKGLGDEGINLVLACSMPNMKRINISCNSITDGSETAFESLSRSTKLEEISIGGNQIGNRIATALSRSTAWKDLKLLALNSNKIGDEGAIAIASNSTWTNLEGLYLSGNKIGDKGAEAIGQNQTWKNLKFLSLYANKIGDDGAVALSSNIQWKNLEELCLDTNEIGDKGASAIGENRTWTNLRILFLGSNKISDDGASVIGQNTTWTNLEMLHLYQNQIGSKGATTLGENKTWKNLNLLALGDNKIGKDGAAALESNTTWTGLRELNLSKNSVGSITWGTNKWRNLRVLSLNSNEIGDEGAVSIGEDKTWTDLEILYLQGNKIGDKGATAIGNNTNWKQLRMLILSSNHINDAGATALGDNTTWTNLEVLWLNSNQIGDKGASSIAKNTTWANLKALCLHINVIGDKGAAALGANTSWVNLKEFNLSSNNIGDEGAGALAANEIWKQLESFQITANWLISEIGKKALKENQIFGSKCHIKDSIK